MNYPENSQQYAQGLPGRGYPPPEDQPMAGPRDVSYVGKRVALLTQHGKESVIAPVLNQALGCRVERVAGYDTDLLGTFTREIPRPETQIGTARKKARIGMEIAGMKTGVASEGAFGPDPYSGLLPWNLEFVLFIDDALDLEVTGVAQGTAVFDHLLASDWASAMNFARKVHFPVQQLVVRPDGADDPRLRKGLSDWPSFESAFVWALEDSGSGQVFLETDLRAHANPSRMANIRLAAEDLAKKLSSLCPVCRMPGFWLVERVAGLPCENCFAPTKEVRIGIYGCLKCGHRESRERPDRQYADPGRCDYCNP